MITLYGRGSNGIKEWSIWTEGNTIYIFANGVKHTEIIRVGKAGRSVEEQIESRVNSRIQRKLNSGFKHSIKDVEKEVTNQLGLYAPMLAQRHDKIKIDPYIRTYVQAKYNGHRCLVNEEIAYSRGGKEITSIKEILSAVDVPEGTTLDGELYCHRIPLQTISSWIKKRQEFTKRLVYMVYDIIIPDATFSERLEILRRLNYTNGLVELADTKIALSLDYPEAYCKNKIMDGYEGAILRPDDGLYEIGKRSKKLIKVKMMEDDEFQCVGILSSKEGWAILQVKARNGSIFKTSAPGSHEEKRYVLENKEEFIGKYVTCKYAELTSAGIPSHCVALDWRIEL